MLTSPEIRAELEKAKWFLNPRTCTANYENWQYGDEDAAVVELYRNGRHAVYGDAHRVLQFAAIAGITPQGYRFVKEETDG